MSATLLTCLVYLLLAGAALGLTVTTYDGCTACCSKSVNHSCFSFSNSTYPDILFASITTTDPCLGSGSNVGITLGAVYYPAPNIWDWEWVGSIPWGAGTITSATLEVLAVAFPAPANCPACVPLLVIGYECPPGTPHTAALWPSDLAVLGFYNWELPENYIKCYSDSGGGFSALLSG